MNADSPLFSLSPPCSTPVVPFYSFPFPTYREEEEEENEGKKEKPKKTWKYSGVRYYVSTVVEEEKNKFMQKIIHFLQWSLF